MAANKGNGTVRALHAVCVIVVCMAVFSVIMVAVDRFWPGVVERSLEPLYGLLAGLLDGLLSGLMFAFLVAVIGGLYFLPTFVGKGKINAPGIFLLNLFLGWTFLGRVDTTMV